MSVEIMNEVEAADTGDVQTATQKELKSSSSLKYVVDATGRKIGWRKLQALEAMDLSEIAAQNSTNTGWMIYATLAYSVREIDGQKLALPKTKSALRARIQQLGDDGLDALTKAMSPDEDGVGEDEIDKAKN